ncbi:MAG TPA: 4-hydroxy-3-methylbut-2-enyl diphosphate reductase [Candidatus Eisenbacteria bacterium]|nr:4-hydroxy-3-methylbut-2-enyl diphosphate reductase [Candidatus Eisenbacteria bacterium]
MNHDLDVIDINPRGYCKGVVRALRIVKNTREMYPNLKISILGKIVHNRFITKALDYYQIDTVDKAGLSRDELLEYVDQGILILSAHGSSEKVKKQALAKGLKIIDAACHDVLSTHYLIRDALDAGKQILFIGKNNHPETEAVLENFPQAKLVTSVSELKNLDLDESKPIFVTNQTTLSILEIQDVLANIIALYPNAEIADEICGATRVRQEAVLKKSKLDALIVVGDPDSNNTAMLAQIGRDNGVPFVQRIETLEDLNLGIFKKGWKVGISSGASTPTYLTEMISDYLKLVDLANPQKRPQIDLTKILD